MFNDFSFNESSLFLGDSQPFFYNPYIQEEINFDNVESRFAHSSEINISLLEEEKDNKDDDSFSNSNSNNTSITTNRKRGRKNDRNDSQHDKYKNDCRMAKIQTGYFTFIILLLNTIMKKMNLKYEFLQLNGKYKSNINQVFRAYLNKKTIKEIIEEAPISPKYKKDKNHNKNVINKLKEEGHDIILDILEKKFLFFFMYIYFPNIKKFNLSSLELKSFDVELPIKIKLFKDLLNKNKNDNFDKYKNDMEKCAKKYFFSNEEEL